MKIAEKIRTLLPNMDTIIITSEDQDIIDGFKKDFVSNNSESKFEWKYIFNTFDKMQGNGSTKSYNKQILNEYGMENIMLRMLSTIYLQQNAKIYVLQLRSNQARNIWRISHFINLFDINMDTTGVQI